MDSRNKRKFYRVATAFDVTFFRDSVERTVQREQTAFAENCSAGGMFIATDVPLSRGSVMQLEFTLNNAHIAETRPISARAIVRWVQRTVKHPGMGVEFLLFNRFGKHEFQQQLADLRK